MRKKEKDRELPESMSGFKILLLLVTFLAVTNMPLNQNPIFRGKRGEPRFLLAAALLELLPAAAGTRIVTAGLGSLPHDRWGRQELSRRVIPHAVGPLERG
jgi:hypothetical protein